MLDIKKYVLRAIAVLSFVTALFLVVGLVASDKNEHTTLMAGLIVMFAAVGGLLWYWSGAAAATMTSREMRQLQIAKTIAQMRQTLTRQANAFLDGVNARGGFEPIRPTRVISRESNPVLGASNAMLSELTIEQGMQHLSTRRRGAYGRTYVSGYSIPIDYQVLRSSAPGELAITPSALIFDAPDRTEDIALDAITHVETGLDRITLSVRNQDRPLMFSVPNGLLWGTLIHYLLHTKVNGYQLPEGATLQTIEE